MLLKVFKNIPDMKLKMDKDDAWNYYFHDLAIDFKT